MKKKILCLATMIVLAASTSMTTYAVSHQGKDGWLADFDGKKINSNFKSSNLADDAANVQPGDSIEFKVKIKNADSEKADWYMANEVIQTLEEANKAANGGAYEYRLSYVNSTETKTLYDSSIVGGESTDNNAEGLHQVSEALKDYYYLDRLSSGQTGEVHLWVKVDGETQGNGYQQTLAKLKMNFAVEKVPGTTTKTTKTTVIKQAPRTGDTTNILRYCVVALASGIVLLGLGGRTLRKSRKRKGE